MKVRDVFILFVSGSLLLSCGDYEVAPEPEGDPSGAIIDSEVSPVAEKTFTLRLGIYVVDGNGAVVPGLTKQNFSIETVRMGEQDSIIFENVEVAGTKTNSKGNYSASLLLDQTESIRDTDPENRRIQAARIFGESLGARDYALLSSFSAKYAPPYVRLHTEYTQDTSVLNAGLDELLTLPDGGTPLYQAAYYMVDHTANNAPATNKAIVLFTDGDDTEGGTSFSELTAYAKEHDVEIYTVGLSWRVKIGVLSAIARETGGSFLWAQDARQLISGFGTLGKLLNGNADYYETKWQATQIGNGWSPSDPVVVRVIVRLPNGDRFTVPYEVLAP